MCYFEMCYFIIAIVLGTQDQTLNNYFYFCVYLFTFQVLKKLGTVLLLLE